MSLETGSVSCRLFYLIHPLQDEPVPLFAKHAAPPIETLGVGELHGWVTGRHLLDRHITADTATLAGYLRLTLMKAERKIPAALLRAECKLEELAELQARGLAFLKRNEKSAIRKSVTDRLLPTMPPTLTGIDIVSEPHGDWVYATATSDKQVEALTAQFRATTGRDLIAMMPATIAAKHRKLDVRNLPASSFSPEVDDGDAGNHTGHEFLTWLWFFSETRGGIADLDVGQVAVAIEGPLTFVFEGSGAHETSLRKGTPEISVEAKSALLGGKKLRRARLTLACHEQTWELGLDASEFVLRGIKLPKGENVDSISRFQDRVLALGTLRDMLEQLYLRYLDERTDGKAWASTQTDIHKWVAQRQARK